MTGVSHTGVAVVGVGSTDYGSLYPTRDPLRSQEMLGIEALTRALDDAGLSRDELDGLLVSRIGSYERMATMIGATNLKVINGYDGAGRMAGVVLQHAVALIQAGLATTIALVYGNNGRSTGAAYGGEGGRQEAYYDNAYGMTSPGAYVAMMYRRYAGLYGVPDGALAPLALSNRRNAMLNPAAAMRNPLDVDQYLSSRFIAEPLRLYDYCIINDGGVAMIVTTEARARSLQSTAVSIDAIASLSNITNFYTSNDFFYDAGKTVADELYRRAGIGPSDVDVVEIYDNFTPTILFSLEAFGYAGKGQSWRWIQEGRIDRDGEVPINTSGGHTSEGYMQGWALQVEAIRQVRGDAGERQIAGAGTVQYICLSPIITSHIFRRTEK